MSTRQESLATFETADAGLLAEMSLLDEVCRGESDFAILLWQTQTALVIPKAQSRRTGFGSAAHRSAVRGWPVSLRPTGGGTTPQGPGILNAAIAFRVPARTSYTIHDAYRTLCRPLQNALGELGLSTVCQAVPGSFCDGRYNIAVAGQKLVGTAQRWRRGRAPAGERTVLAHALILHTVDLVPAVDAINALHDELSINESIEPAAHATLWDTGVDIDVGLLANMISDHLHRTCAPSNPFERELAILG